MKLSYQKMQALLVEGNKMALDTLEGYLEPFKFYRVWTAVGVDEAMLAIKDRPIDIIITGWKMQPISGLQLVEMARRRPELKDAPILLVADRRDKHLEKIGKDSGATAVIGHPITAKDVQRVVDEMLSKRIDPQHEQFLAHMEAARQAERRKKSAEAIEAYRQALELFEDETAMMALARLLRRAGDEDGATKLLFATLRANPDALKAYLELAMIYRGQSRLEDALKVMQAALGAAERLKHGGLTKASLYYYMGEIELQLKHLQKALGHFDMAMGELPDDVEMASNIGDALAGQGHYAESEQYYQKALELDPSLAHVYNRLGIAHRRQGKHDMALNLYRKALAFHPNDEHLLYNMARVHWELAEYQLASEVLTKALEINPELVEAQRLLGAALHRMGFQVTADGAPPEPGDD